VPIDLEQQQDTTSLEKTEDSSPVKVKDWPSKNALCLQTQQSLLGINGSRIGKLAARLATLIQVPNQLAKQGGQQPASNIDEAGLEQEFESFHRQVYSVAKPRKAGRKTKQQPVNRVIDESRLTDDARWEKQQDNTKEEMTETSTNVQKAAEYSQLEESKDSGITDSSRLISEDLESVCSYSDTIQKNKPKRGRPAKECTVTTSSWKRRRKTNRLEASSCESDQVARTTAPKGVDELLDNFLLLEEKIFGKKFSGPRKIPNWHVNFMEAKPEELHKTCYTREEMIARLQYMYGKNIAGQFSFDITEHMPHLNVPMKSCAFKMTKPVKKKKTRRLKLRLYLPS